LEKEQTAGKKNERGKTRLVKTTKPDAMGTGDMIGVREKGQSLRCNEEVAEKQ